MPRFLNQITENGNSVPSSNNNSVTNIMYVTQEEFDTLVEQNKLIENTIYMINETSSGGGGTTADLLDIFWPVGSYYETNDPNFNPNISWGGTWVQDTKGYVTVGATNPDESQGSNNNKLILNVNNTTGEVKHTLSINEMPSHNHFVYYKQDYGDYGDVDTFNYTGYFDANGAPKSMTSTGGSQPHNNVQPSIGVYRWHRTA